MYKGLSFDPNGYNSVKRQGNIRLSVVVLQRSVAAVFGCIHFKGLSYD